MLWLRGGNRDTITVSFPVLIGAGGVAWPGDRLLVDQVHRFGVPDGLAQFHEQCEP